MKKYIKVKFKKNGEFDYIEFLYKRFFKWGLTVFSDLNNDKCWKPSMSTVFSEDIISQSYFLDGNCRDISFVNFNLGKRYIITVCKPKEIKKYEKYGFKITEYDNVSKQYIIIRDNGEQDDV